MLSYILFIDENHDIAVYCNRHGNSESIYLESKHIFLQEDHQFLLSEFGVPMNDFELSYFKANYYIWEHFVKSGEAYCMIREDKVKLNIDNDQLCNLTEGLPPDWDVFFPFDKTAVPTQLQLLDMYTSKQGYYWGCHIYFLSKRGAQKMCEIQSIRQPVDEEILLRSSLQKLEVYVESTTCFEYNEMLAPSYIERKKKLASTIMNYPGWNDQNKKIAQELIKHLVNHAKTLDIDLVLCGGSLLGAIRHRGIMSWDDDIDLGIHHSHIDRLIESITLEGKVKTLPWPWRYNNADTIYYKFWLDDGEPISGFPYKFPFIDIWIYYDEDESTVVYKEGFVYKKDDYLPLATTIFEGSELKIPNNPMKVLDGQYNNWREYILIFNYCHRLEIPVFKNLRLSITVDDNGYLQL